MAPAIRAGRGLPVRPAKALGRCSNPAAVGTSYRTAVAGGARVTGVRFVRGERAKAVGPGGRMLRGGFRRVSTPARASESPAKVKADVWGPRQEFFSLIGRAHVSPPATS